MLKDILNDYYLIGLVIDNGIFDFKRNFWINELSKEIRLFHEFVNYVEPYVKNEFSLFSYGSYDLKFLIYLKSQIKWKSKKAVVQKLIDNHFDVLKVFMYNIYLPTYRNDLKSIAAYLGYKRDDNKYDGFSVFVWRKKWEENNDFELKNKIEKYNFEDCYSLQFLVHFIINIKNGKTQGINVSEDLSEEIERRYAGRKFSLKNHILENYDNINKRAYFDYQRDKVLFKRNNKPSGKKSMIYKKTISLKPDTQIIIKELNKCPICRSNKNVLISNSYLTRTIIDLKYLNSGIKKNIKEYKAFNLYCSKCLKTYKSKRYNDIGQKYGKTLIIWAIYQHVTNHTSLGKIYSTLEDIFNISLKPLLSGHLFNYNTKLEKCYLNVFISIKNNICNWNILHIDETKIKTRNGYGYIWIFSNLDSIFYLYRQDRKSDFLNEILMDFKGVLISDFYKGYDSFNCPQQKCLVHLLRDVNDLLFKEQLNEELSFIANNFTTLMQKILDTIDVYGLKKRNLHKHLKDVNKFFVQLDNNKFRTPSVIKLAKRFNLYKDRLFTFLNYNDVPWNNNNAEHTIKHLAIYRRNVSGVVTEKGLESYLHHLSIFQTCNYRSINYFHFLLSQETSFESYQMKYTKHGNIRKKYKK